MDQNHGEPMDMTPSPGSMGPPTQNSPDAEHTLGAGTTLGSDVGPMSTGQVPNGVSAAAATSSQQPKVVQTAFIHKLYKCAVSCDDM